MSSEMSPEIAAWVGKRGLGALADKMGIKILALDGTHGVATMPAEGNT